MKRSLYSIPTGLLLLTSGHEALADWDGWSEINANTDHYSTSDDYRRNSVKLNYQRVNVHANAEPLTLGINAAGHRIQNKGVNYHATELGVKARKQVTKQFAIEGNLGVVKVKKPQGDTSQTTTIHRVRAEIQPNTKTTIVLEHNKDLLFREEIGLDNTGNILSTQATAVEMTVRPTKRIAVSGKLQRKRFSDGNRNREAYVGAFYGVTPANDPHLWVGIEGTRLDHDRQEAAYWSPKNHRYIGVNAHGTLPINAKLDLTTNISKGRSKDDNSNGYASTFNASVGAKFKLKKDMDLTLDVRHGQSHRSGEAWKGDGVMLAFNYAF
jgi:hypothetical protein